MEGTQVTDDQQALVDQVYQHAANLLVKEKRDPEDVVSRLTQMGIDDESARVVVDNLQKHITDAKSARAKKDMLYGALWCIGGTIATLAQVGFIFWGAIVFGAIQFFRGLSNSK